MRGQTKIWGRRLLGLWLLFHLFTILSVPNRLSLLNPKVNSVILPYANTLGINQTWQFFSPDPGSPLYLSTEIWKEKKKVDSEFFPELDPPFFKFAYFRRLYIIRALVSFPELTEVLLGPYMCRKYPEANEFEISLMSVKAPSFEDVGERGIPMKDQTKREFSFLKNFVCERNDSP